MRILKNRAFYKWAIREDITDEALIEAAWEINQGLYEANLGGNIYKKRLALVGRGKRGGARVIVAFKLQNIAIFMYGFCKKQKDNITPEEKEALKMLADAYLLQTEEQIKKAIQENKLIEVILQ